MLISNILMIMTVKFIHLNSFISMLIFTIISLLAWKLILKQHVKIYLKKISKTTLLETLPLIGIPFVSIIYFLSNIININYEIVSLMFITSLFTGIYEEIIFRAIVLGSFIKSNLSLKISIFLSALLFSFFHLYSIFEYEMIDIFLKLINTFMMGFILSYIYFLTKNILYVIMIHFIWDFESFLANGYNMGLYISAILFLMTIIYFTWSYKRVNQINVH